jgi:hypothetical protein
MCFWSVAAAVGFGAFGLSGICYMLANSLAWVFSCSVKATSVKQSHATVKRCRVSLLATAVHLTYMQCGVVGVAQVQVSVLCGFQHTPLFVNAETAVVDALNCQRPAGCVAGPDKAHVVVNLFAEVYFCFGMCVECVCVAKFVEGHFLGQAVFKHAAELS